MPPHTHADSLHLAAWNLNHRTGYWRQVNAIARLARDRPVTFSGDFRCDQHTQTRLGEALFPRLTADGYTLAGPANGHGDPLSDHALLSIRVQRPLQADHPAHLKATLSSACTTRSAMR